VGIEVPGMFMNQGQSKFIEDPHLSVRARSTELEDYCAYSLASEAFLSSWHRSRLDPACEYGIKLQRQTLALRLIPIPPLWRLEKHFYDKWGWVTMPPAPIPPEEYRRGFDVTRTMFEGDMEHFEVSRHNDRILRQMLDLCLKNNIDVFLFRMPEATDFQALFTPCATVALDNYFKRITADYGVQLIDSRFWLTDPADFTDGHHLNADGAAKFTPRFIDAMLLSGKALPLKPVMQ